MPGSVPSPADFPKGDRFAPRSSHPTVGLDDKPVRKLVAGTTDHYIYELPDSVLEANGISFMQDALETVTGEPVSKAEALEELAELADGMALEGGDE